MCKIYILILLGEGKKKECIEKCKNVKKGRLREIMREKNFNLLMTRVTNTITLYDSSPMYVTSSKILFYSGLFVFEIWWNDTTI